MMITTALPHRLSIMRAAVLVVAAFAGADTYTARPASAGVNLFEDDFESGLARWDVYGSGGVRLTDSRDQRHRRVLELIPNGDVFVLLKGSSGFGPARLEGDVLFPDDTDNYLGVIYNFGKIGRRTDFGVIYIKGNDSYLQVNPHRDLNVSRALYPEYRAPLTGESAVRPREWQRFALEVSGDTAHFYVGNTRTPQLIFGDFERKTGSLGLQPRSVGGSVWVDNVRVSSLPRLSYTGPGVVGMTQTPAGLLRDWSIAGPFTETRDDLARNPTGRAGDWRPYATDRRGAVVTGRAVDYHGPKTVAYFRAQVHRDTAGPADLRLSTIDDLALWVNGRFHWFIPRADTAWFDFLGNPARKAQSIPVDLVAGTNSLVFRVRGGVYASGGFFAAIVD